MVDYRDSIIDRLQRRYAPECEKAFDVLMNTEIPDPVEMQRLAQAAWETDDE